MEDSGAISSLVMQADAFSPLEQKADNLTPASLSGSLEWGQTIVGGQMHVPLGLVDQVVEALGVAFLAGIEHWCCSCHGTKSLQSSRVKFLSTDLMEWKLKGCVHDTQNLKD